MECCKVIGGITSCRAETQVIGSLVPLNRRRKMLKFIGWGKKSAPECITQRQLFQGRERSDCSSGTRSSSQRLRWRHVAGVTSEIIAAEQLQIRITNLRRLSWPSDHIATPPRHVLRHGGALTTTAADPFPLSNLPADAHPRPHASIERS